MTKSSRFEVEVTRTGQGGRSTTFILKVDDKPIGKVHGGVVNEREATMVAFACGQTLKQAMEHMEKAHG